MKHKDDCLRQCVARVTKIPPRRVPHFVGKYKDRWFRHLGTWLGRRGWFVVLCNATDTIAYIPKSAPHIEIGPTSRGKRKRRHAVVCKGPLPVYTGGRPLLKTERYLFLFRERRQ